MKRRVLLSLALVAALPVSAGPTVDSMHGVIKSTVIANLQEHQAVVIDAIHKAALKHGALDVAALAANGGFDVCVKLPSDPSTFYYFPVKVNA